MQTEAPREFLIDVSRLVWRLSSGRLPTGIDRVAAEYFNHFGSRSQAVVQYKGRAFVLSAKDSDRLLQLVSKGPSNFRSAMIAAAPGALIRSRRSPPRKGMIYLNVGHTGLDAGELVNWIEEHRLRAVFMVHDLIPLTHPQFCRVGEGARHAKRMRNALASAAGIIGNSNATLVELAEFARASDLSMPPCTAAWLGVAKLPEDALVPDVGRPYFVAVGTIEGRKNHILLLKLWRKLAERLGERAPLLVVIGQRGWQAEESFAILDDPGALRPHILELNACSDTELAGWLKGARALLMPSFAEGFGLPVIEALQLATPVIAADLPVYREIAGDIPLYLDPADEAGWLQAVEDFAGQGDCRTQQVEKARQYRPPSWSAHFDAVEAFVARIAAS